MKYEIDGIEKGRTIKSVQFINRSGKTQTNGLPEKIKIIMVDYLDGTQDVFEFNEETLDRIKNKVDTQAKTFVDGQKDKFPLLAECNAILALIAVVLSVVLIFVDKTIIFGVISAITSFALACNAARIYTKNRSIKKHQIYINKIMGKLEEYNEILKKEKVLSKENNKELVNIINIDDKTIKQLEDIGNKIERYNEIEGKSPKKKTL